MTKLQPKIFNKLPQKIQTVKKILPKINKNIKNVTQKIPKIYFEDLKLDKTMFR